MSDVYAPLAAPVVARNEALDATPELVNTDPYGDGWLFEIVPADPVRPGSWTPRPTRPPSS